MRAGQRNESPATFKRELKVTWLTRTGRFHWTGRRYCFLLFRSRCSTTASYCFHCCQGRASDKGAPNCAQISTSPSFFLTSRIVFGFHRTAVLYSRIGFSTGVFTFFRVVPCGNVHGCFWDLPNSFEPGCDLAKGRLRAPVVSSRSIRGGGAVRWTNCCRSREAVGRTQKFGPKALGVRFISGRPHVALISSRIDPSNRSISWSLGQSCWFSIIFFLYFDVFFCLSISVSSTLSGFIW